MLLLSLALILLISSFEVCFPPSTVLQTFNQHFILYLEMTMDLKISLNTGARMTIQEFYSNLGKRYEDAYGHNAGLQRMVQHFLDLLPPKASVLDCGCGTGKPVSYMIAESGRKPYGIDLSPRMVELSKKQVPRGTFKQCNMLDYTAAPATFAGATVILSIFGRDRAAITRIARNLFNWIQPGGHLLLCVFGAEDRKNRPEQHDPDGECAHGINSIFMAHISYMTPVTKKGWTKMLESVGFEIAKTKTDTFDTPKEAVCDDDLYYYIIAKKPDVRASL